MSDKEVISIGTRITLKTPSGAEFSVSAEGDTLTVVAPKDLADVDVQGDTVYIAGADYEDEP